jgi:hypothetical protein
MAGVSIDPWLRAEFRETARTIVQRDRQARKLGHSQNTIAEIERAMAGAYRLGRDGGESLPTAEPIAESAIDWAVIPPRARQALDDMTWCPVGFDVELPHGVRCVEIAGRERWARIFRSGQTDERAFHPSAIHPLCKLGLLEPVPDDPGLLVLSARGRATCELYHARRAARDPNLPALSIRV